MDDKFSGAWSKGRFLRFVYPSIVMLGFVALYNCTAAFFVARYVGPEALAALNIVQPIVNLLLGFGLMLSVGGAAVIGMYLGAGDRLNANQKFTQTVIANLILSLIICSVIRIFFDTILSLLGANGALLEPAREYLSVMLCFGPIFTVSVSFEFLSRADGAPRVSLIATIVGGLLNIVLDYLFLGVLGWGVGAAALSAGIGNIIAATISIVYFMSSRSTLKFVKTPVDFKFLGSASFNGSSELINALSAGFVTFLYNQQALKLMGTTGVAAISALMFFNWLIIALQLGASTGYSPLLSYSWGAKNERLFRSFLRSSLIVTVAMTIFALVLGMVFGPTIIGIFGGGKKELTELLSLAVRIFSIQYIFSAFNIFTSGFFTSIGDGKTSALISILRSLVGSIAGVLFLPSLFGITGLWMVGPFAELTTFVIAFIIFIHFIHMQKIKGKNFVA